MADFFDIDGLKLLSIMGNEYVQRVAPGLPVWEIKGLGENFERNRRNLLKQVVEWYPGSILRYPRKDENLEGLKGSWENTAPSLWQIPRDLDFEELYPVLRDTGWGIYPADRDFKPTVVAHKDHEKRLIWIEYTGIAFALENHHMHYCWVLSVNPRPDVEYERPPAPVRQLQLDYPVLARLLGIWIGNSELAGTAKESDLLKWFARVASSDDRKAFVQEGREFVAGVSPDWEAIEMKAQRRFKSPDEAQKWLSDVVHVFDKAEQIQSDEKRLLEIVESAAAEFDGDLRSKRIVAVVDGVSVSSYEPRESDAKISIRFIEGEHNYDVEQHIETIFIPMYRRGVKMNEGDVGQRTREQLRISADLGPYIKLCLPRLVEPVTHKLAIILGICLLLYLIFFALRSM